MKTRTETYLMINSRNKSNEIFLKALAWLRRITYESFEAAPAPIIIVSYKQWMEMQLSFMILLFVRQYGYFIAHLRPVCCVGAPKTTGYFTAEPLWRRQTSNNRRRSHWNGLTGEPCHPQPDRLFPCVLRNKVNEYLLLSTLYPAPDITMCR